MIIPPALYLAAGWVPWEALAFASRVLFVGMVAMAATGRGPRATGMAAAERRRKRDMTEETYSRPDVDRAIEAAFRLGFGNALAEVDGDLHPFGHGRRRRCCAACSVLANATAKFQDGRYPWAAPPTVETLEAVQKHKERGQ